MTIGASTATLMVCVTLMIPSRLRVAFGFWLLVFFVFVIVWAVPSTYPECYSDADCAGYVCSGYQCDCYPQPYSWQCLNDEHLFTPVNPFGIVAFVALAMMVLIACQF